MIVSGHLNINRLSWLVLVLVVLLLSLVLANLITSESLPLLITASLFACGVYLYSLHVELFIVLVLIINQECFNLLPTPPVYWVYQDVLFALLPICWMTTGPGKKQGVAGAGRKYSDMIVASLMGLTLLGIVTSSLAGQPVFMGLKAAKGYYLLLFYFVLSRSSVDFAKLTKFIVGTGVALCVANNVQYLYWGEIDLFHTTATERLGNLRFLSGDFFTILAPLIAFGEYVTSRKKGYLLASLYMISTVVIQGQTRAVIFGLFGSCLVLLFISSNTLADKLKIVGGAFLAIVLSSILWQGLNLWEGLWDLTTKELSSDRGNVAIRLRGYEYYFAEVLKSPIWGGGIWSGQVAGSNPENMKQFGIDLTDLGIMQVFFHFGSLGITWLVASVVISFVRLSAILRKGVRAMDYGIVAYFVFGSLTLVTLNCFVDNRTIIYLVLALVVIAHHDQLEVEEIESEAHH
jgi:hypothetical protein